MSDQEQSEDLKLELAVQDEEVPAEIAEAKEEAEKQLEERPKKLYHGFLR